MAPAGSRPCTQRLSALLAGCRGCHGQACPAGSMRTGSEPVPPAASRASGRRLRMHRATLPRAVPFTPQRAPQAGEDQGRTHAAAWRRTSAGSGAASPPPPPSAARHPHERADAPPAPDGCYRPPCRVTRNRHRAFGWTFRCPLPTCETRRCGSAGRGCTGRTLCETRLDWPRTLGNRKSIPLQPAPARRGPT